MKTKLSFFILFFTLVINKSSHSQAFIARGEYYSSIQPGVHGAAFNYGLFNNKRKIFAFTSTGGYQRTWCDKNNHIFGDSVDVFNEINFKLGPRIGKGRLRFVTEVEIGVGWGKNLNYDKNIEGSKKSIVTLPIRANTGFVFFISNKFAIHPKIGYDLIIMKPFWGIGIEFTKVM